MPSTRCQVAETPISGLDYNRYAAGFGTSVNDPHIITTYYDRLEGGRQAHWFVTLADNDEYSRNLRDLSRTIQAALEGARAAWPPITNTGPTRRQIQSSGIPEIIQRAIYECDGAILLDVANSLDISLGGSVPTDREVIDQLLQAERFAEQARARYAPSFQANPPTPKKKSSSGGTIAAIGGAALIAGGLTWLLWPDAKHTIQPWTKGKNDGLGYAAGIQMKLGRKANFRFYQSGVDGPREHRATHAAIDLRW